MYSLVGNLALDLLLAINSKALKEIPKLKTWGHVEDVSENNAVIHLSLGIPEKLESFCVIEITVTQYDKEVFFEVIAKHEEFDIEVSDLHRINIDDLMSQYADLRPVITEGFRHYYNIDEFQKTDIVKPAARRTFEVNYTAVFEFIEEQTSQVNYGFDKMANKAFPYIKSLHEIYKIIHPEEAEFSGLKSSSI